MIWPFSHKKRKPTEEEIESFNREISACMNEDTSNMDVEELEEYARESIERIEAVVSKCKDIMTEDDKAKCKHLIDGLRPIAKGGA